MKMPAFLRAMRPQQWAKNVFVLAAYGFAFGDQSQTLDEGALASAMLAFCSFSLGASTIYLINDVLDIEADRVHPTKRLRPIAAGELSVPSAIAGSGILCVASLGLGYFASASHQLPLIVGGYMTLNLAYSLRLKQIVLLDVFCIATGFLLRVIGGGLAVGAPVSRWLLLCTLFLALFLGFNKRRAELAAMGDESGTRSTLSQYSLPLLDQLVSMIAACAIVCYALYTLDPITQSKFGSGADNLVFSVPFVVFGIARYLHLVQTERGGESPTRILLGGDGLFLLAIVGWLTVVAWSIAPQA